MLATQRRWDCGLLYQPAPRLLSADSRSADPRRRRECRSFHGNWQPIAEQPSCPEVGGWRLFSKACGMAMRVVEDELANRTAPEAHTCHIPGRIVQLRHSGQTVYFVEVAKSASTTIKAMLAAEANAEPRRVCSPGTWPRRTLSFTFVRDPLDRMISAFHEVVTRLAACPDSCTLPAFVELGKRREYIASFKAFVEHVTSPAGAKGIRIRCADNLDRVNLLTPCHVCALEHTASQLWHLQVYPYPIDFVGRVESLDQDLQALQQHLGLRLRGSGMHANARNASALGAHTMGAGAAPAREMLLKAAPRAVDKLVRHLRHEYTCFGYSMPKLAEY